MLFNTLCSTDYCNLQTYKWLQSVNEKILRMHVSRTKSDKNIQDKQKAYDLLYTTEPVYFVCYTVIQEYKNQ